MARATYQFIALTIVWLFRAFVLMKLWSWFVATAFGVPLLSYQSVVGILLIAYLIYGAFADDPWPNEDRWRRLLDVLQRIAANGLSKSATDESGIQDFDSPLFTWEYTFRQLLAAASVLAFGWGLHRFL